ncbi:MAG: NAD(P)/FAD-dependent oxidoreductase [Pseudomonadota bacterium]
MDDKHVVVIGGGLGGLLAAIKLKEAGYTFTLLEKNKSVGGTWHENKYPGCSCDVPVALYEYSFAQSMVWSKGYPIADEVEAYANELVERYQLAPSIRLEEAASRAEWSDANKSWHVTTSSGETIEAMAVVSALGQLNRPKLPAIDGLDTFEGPAMHTARWDRSVDWAGKKVGVLGTGASAVQLVPPMAETADHLTVFQRSPNYIVPRPDQPITPQDKALAASNLESAMLIYSLNRQLIFENADRLSWKAFEWTPEGRAAFTARALNFLHSKISDPDMRKALTPDYPIGCRRILICDDYYDTLNRDNVTLETTHIKRIHPTAVELEDGRMVDCDILALATGFNTSDWNLSVDISGAGGLALKDVWADVPRAYYGISVSGFPNFFMLYGPNTNLGHNSITAMMEAQMGHIIKALAVLGETGAAALAPTEKAQSAFNTQLQDDLKGTVWGDEECGASWYKTEEGFITQNWSGTVAAYREAVADIRRQDYELIE